jgi:hypothetical protein
VASEMRDGGDRLLYYLSLTSQVHTVSDDMLDLILILLAPDLFHPCWIGLTGRPRTVT